jgi:hypothetical protein
MQGGVHRFACIRMMIAKPAVCEQGTSEVTQPGAEVPLALGNVPGPSSDPEKLGHSSDPGSQQPQEPLQQLTGDTCAAVPATTSTNQGAATHNRRRKTAKPKGIAEEVAALQAETTTSCQLPVNGGDHRSIQNESSGAELAKEGGENGSPGHPARAMATRGSGGDVGEQGFRTQPPQRSRRVTRAWVRSHPMSQTDSSGLLREGAATSTESQGKERVEASGKGHQGKSKKRSKGGRAGSMADQENSLAVANSALPTDNPPARQVEHLSRMRSFCWEGGACWARW